MTRSTPFRSARVVRLVCLTICLIILVCSDLLRPSHSAGISTVSQQGPGVIGQWSSEISVPIVAIHMHLLPNGKVLIFQDDDDPDYPNDEDERWPGLTVAYVWDVGSGVFTQVNNDDANVFCSGHAFLPDGRLLFAGGLHAPGKGISDGFIFNSSDNTWTPTNEPMDYARWYPSNVTLGNGEIAVVAGVNQIGQHSNTPEVFETNSGGGWRALTTAMLQLALYPYLHLAPNGKVFVSGPERATRYLDTSGSGGWTAVATRVVDYNRDYGSSVTYDVGKVVIIGGGNPPISSAETIDLNNPSPSWTTRGSMASARRQMNSTILPNGKVLVTGGTSTGGDDSGDSLEAAGALLTTEMWDPGNGNFTTMASMTKPRLYHSTAILLGDGRVLTAGGGRPGTEQRNAQIYSPPYLFTAGGAAATRPTIDSHISKGIRPGQTLFITTPDAANISDVTLVALSSVTHARNMTQRFNRLAFTQGTGGLNVTMPANGNACPPGFYMLFILNSNGVPSLAHFISVNSSNPLPPSAPLSFAATATSTSSVSLSWTANGLVDHYEIQRGTHRNGSFTTLAPTSGTSFVDNSVSSSTVYIYRVRAVDSQGNYSDFNTDVASTYTFTDNPLVAGTTLVRAQHIAELRTLVDAVRTAAGLSGAIWTDGSLADVNIKAVHISELRSNLDSALSQLGVTTNSYTDSVLTPGTTTVKAVHAQELRSRVQ